MEIVELAEIRTSFQQGDQEFRRFIDFKSLDLLISL
jgi:hypothetical protein